jgi:undecaprenyl-diphosphatase
MTYLEALLYGAVQGITEYLPISSSAHLILLPKFMGTRDPGLAFDVFLHLGTLAATLAYFWREWRQVFVTLPFIGRPPHSGGVSWKPIALATLPALLAGAILHGWVETVFRGETVIMVTLVLGGVLLYASDRFARGDRAIEGLSLKDALWIGIAQCFALVPGISRSGSTITGGRILGFDRATAARFSFLISAPVTGAAIVFEMRKWPELVNGPVGWDALLLAGVSSFVFGCIAIGGLMRMLKRFGYLSFAVYRIGLAVAIYFVIR